MNVTNNQEFIKSIKEQISPFAEAYASGTSSREIAKQIYCTLPGKSDDIGYTMADMMTKLIEKYHSDYEECYEDEDAFIRRKLMECTENIESSVDRCNVYLKMLRSIATYCDDSSKTMNSNNSFRFSEETAAENEQELFDSLVEAIKLSDSSMLNLPEMLNAIESGELNVSEFDVLFGRGSKDLKLIMSMQAYVNVLNKMYDDMGVDVSMESIVYSVCSYTDALSAIEEAGDDGSDDLPKEPLIIKILGVIGKVIGVCCIISIALLVINTLVDAIFLSPFPLILKIISGIFISTEFTSDIIRSHMATKFGEKTADLMKKFGYGIGKSAGAMVRGAKKVSAWIVQKSAESFVKCKQLVKKIIAKFSDDDSPEDPPASGALINKDDVRNAGEESIKAPITIPVTDFA